MFKWQIFLILGVVIMAGVVSAVIMSLPDDGDYVTNGNLTATPDYYDSTLSFYVNNNSSLDSNNLICQFSPTCSGSVSSSCSDWDSDYAGCVDYSSHNGQCAWTPALECSGDIDGYICYDIYDIDICNDETNSYCVWYDDGGDGYCDVNIEDLQCEFLTTAGCEYMNTEYAVCDVDTVPSSCDGTLTCSQTTSGGCTSIGCTWGTPTAKTCPFGGIILKNIPTDGLRYWYKFDGASILTDTMGNYNLLGNIGGVAQTDNAGIDLKGAYFNGASRLYGTRRTEISTTKNYTICTAIKVDNESAQPYLSSGGIIDNSASGSDRNCFLVKQGYKVSFGYLTTGSWIGSQGAINMGEWNWVCGRLYNLEATLFINGVSQGANSSRDVYCGGDNQFYIGQITPSSSPYYNEPLRGYLDNLMIWNRSLSDSEIMNMIAYGENNGNPYYWKANETNGTSSDDGDIQTFYLDLFNPVIHINMPTTQRNPTIDFNISSTDTYYNSLNITVNGVIIADYDMDSTEQSYTDTYTIPAGRNLMKVCSEDMSGRTRCEEYYLIGDRVANINLDNSTININAGSIGIYA